MIKTRLCHKVGGDKMPRIFQFRDYEETATFCLDDYNESVINAIKTVRKLMHQYPDDLYFDFEVNSVNKEIEYMDNISDWYEDTKFDLGFYETDDVLNGDENEARKYLKIISDYYGFE